MIPFYILVYHHVVQGIYSHAVGDEMHLVFECASLAALRAEYADLFTTTTTTMRSFFAQSDHLRVFHYVIDCLNMMNA